ncbi:hypothetical protein [Lapidilactobacillus bayanensis]|uniref:hypothetical protein n=1 Tax=Lapidilactobacillus bayanensis TaxID=2485998 RepID=UPI000F77649B|nr:hypothetical protein [Lapidilactobacillus bayanensis]
MQTQTRWEFKRVKGWLWLTILTLMLLSAMYIQTVKMQNEHTILAAPTSIVNTKKRISGQLENIQQTLNYKAQLPKEQEQQMRTANQLYFKKLTKFQTLLFSGHLIKANQLLYQSARDRTPLTSNFVLGHPLGGDALLFSYLVRNKINEVPMLAEQTKAWNILGIFMRLPQLASPDTPGWDGRYLTVEHDFIFIILSFFSLFLCLFWTQERPQTSDNFANVVPVTHHHLLIAKTIVGLGIFIGSLILAALIFVAVLGLNHRFGFGTINYPYLFRNHQKQLQLVTIAEFSVQYLGFTLLWGLFLTRLSKQPIIIFAILNSLIYSKQLGLTPLLGEINPYLPTHYLTFTNLLLARAGYQDLSIAQGVIVLVAWSSLLIITSRLIIKKRGRM